MFTVYPQGFLLGALVIILHPPSPQRPTSGEGSGIVESMRASM